MAIMMKKGQHVILGEILLFIIGLAIANYVLFSFQKAEMRVSKVSLKDNFQLIANTVSTAVTKVTESANSTIRFFLPERISNRVYRVVLRGVSVTVFDVDNPEINVSQKLFNISQENCISDNAFCAQGDIISTARSIEIFSDGKNIILRRT